MWIKSLFYLKNTVYLVEYLFFCFFSEKMSLKGKRHKKRKCFLIQAVTKKAWKENRQKNYPWRNGYSVARGGGRKYVHTGSRNV